MKKITLLIVLVLAITLLMLLTTKAFSLDAEITDKEGIKTKVSGFALYTQDTCKGFMYYAGTPTQTEFHWDFLPLNTGVYTVLIPFNIIEHMRVKQKDDEQYPSSTIKYYEYTVFLIDKTEIKGGFSEGRGYVNELNLNTEFTGTSELGKFNISLKNVKEIFFKHKQTLSFDATPKGKNTTSLILSDNTQLKLEGSIFVKIKKNRNGCYEGQDYTTSMKFKTGESFYDISWEKIASIVFLRDKDDEDKFRLVSKTGSEYVGTSQDSIGIEGIAKIGKYKLSVIVRFNSKASKLLF